MYAKTNFRFLRISKTAVLPLNLFLSEEDLEWFNDFTFQEILSVLKPLLLGRIELYELGHLNKRTPNFANNNNRAVNNIQDIDDGLDDAGVILGGIGEITPAETTTSSAGRRSNKAPSEHRPKFRIRFGFRASTTAERGGSVLAADKNLGFLKVKKEAMDEDEDASLLSASQVSRSIRNDLVADDGVQIREEDESDSLRISDFRRVEEEREEDDDDDGIQVGEDAEYQETGRGSSKRKRGTNTVTNTNNKGGRGRGGRPGRSSAAQEDSVPSSQMDQKPTLQVEYAPLKLHPQTLYIVVQSEGSVALSPFAEFMISSSSASKTSPKTVAETSSEYTSSKNTKESAAKVPQQPATDEFDDGVGKKTDDGTWLFRNVDFEINEGGIMTITGPSGVGKSTLLKCLNQTLVMDEGEVRLSGKTPDEMGIPTWRSRVMYVPQRSPIMEGTPLEFLEEVRRFGAHKKNKGSFDDPVEIGLDWGIRPELWHSKWNTLSGGEIQRISLAIGCSFRPDLLLLDEPTSALDEVSCDQVERTLKQLNCLWVTHNPQQGQRIASAGTLVMRGGDNSNNNSEPDSPADVVIENGEHHHAHQHHGSDSNKDNNNKKSNENGNTSEGTLTSHNSSSSKTARV
ncbi:hypothetical protein BGZ83_000497 [Gryganskiella cystojenkinii]|nr:hypothetical protein BGZ83_000497 [Gryganskiella cystojenkinii]